MVAARGRERPLSITNPNLLLVEGDDDFHFFQRLLEHRQRSEVQVANYAGKDKLGEFLANALVLDPQFSAMVKVVGVTRDADNSFDRAIQSVRDSLRRAQLPFPREPFTYAGGSVRYPNVRVLTYILPDNKNEGDLESLYLQATGSDNAMICAHRYIDCLKANGLMPRYERKARLHAFLAANRDDPTIQPGQAIGAGIIPWDSSAFAGVHQFLDMLDAAN